MTVEDGRKACCCRGWRWVGYALAPLLGAALLLTYLISPRFYLDYVLEATRREFQFVELVTESAALLAGLFLLGAAHRVWHHAPDRTHRPAAMLLALVGVAALFLFGEEISWGQKFGLWETPASYDSVETNIHNLQTMPISVQSLGALFVMGVFFGVPALWRLRDKVPVMNRFQHAVANGPAIFIVAFAFVWKFWKEVYRAVYGEPGELSDFYLGFLEQINEQKEMFIALGLLVYGVSVLARTRSLFLSSRSQVPSSNKLSNSKSQN